MKPGESLAAGLTHSGICSHREAVRRIASGRVTVNGMTVRDGLQKLNASDCVCCDGKPIPEAVERIVYKLYKPRGWVTSYFDRFTEQLAYRLLPELPGVRWASAGRLDAESEGLLIFSNDGRLLHALEAPETGILKTYCVETSYPISDAWLAKFVSGVAVADAKRPLKVHAAQNLGNCTYLLSLAEGQKHEIRRLVQMARSTVRKLLRVQIGPVTLGELKPGECRELTEGELEELLAYAKMKSGENR